METKYEGGASPNCTIPFYNWDMGYDAKVFYCVEGAVFKQGMHV